MVHHIVQLTDCHLFSDRGRSLRDVVTWPRWVAMLQFVRRQVPEIDLLAITGDTAHDEAKATYVAVRDLLQDVLGAAWSERVRIIPGNHDDRDTLRSLFPQPGSGPIDRVTFQERWDDWQVIGLDSQRPGELPG